MGDSTSHFLHRLFSQYAGELEAFARRRVGAQEAPDILQEIYLRILEHADRIQLDAPRALLYKTASNLAVDALRRAETRRSHHTDEPLDLETLESPAPGPEALAESADELRCFRAALVELPSLCRHAFLLSRSDGLTHAEIAVRLGISKRTIDRYIVQALEHLRARLGR